MAHESPLVSTLSDEELRRELKAIPYIPIELPELPSTLPFDPYFVKTDNVLASLGQFAKERRIDPKQIDFDIVSVITFIQQGNDEPVEVKDDEFSKLEDITLLLDPKISIKQTLEIRIRPLLPAPHQMILAMTANRSISRVTATIKKESKFLYEPGLEEWIVNELNKRKARNAILINLWCFRMFQDVASIVNIIRTNGKLDSDVEIELARAIEPIPTVNDQLILHYKHKTNADVTSQPNIDRTNRNFIVSVGSNELIVEYIKPKTGRPGRSCRGNYIPAPEPSVRFKPEFKTGDGIAINETDESIRYIAKRPGYVIFKDNILDIGDELALSQISFKKTGSIKTILDSSIKIEVKEGDIMEDSVGDNMKVEVAELKVRGSIGRGASIKAKIVEVGGQTHQSSTIHADTITVNSHRGYAEGKKLTFERVEGGVALGEEIVCHQATGSRLTAKEIHITNLGSNNILTASTLLEIKNMIGTGNKLIMKPLQIGEESVDVTARELELEALEKLVESLIRDHRAKADMIKQNNEKINQIKNRILEDRKFNRATPSVLVNEYQRFLSIAKEVQQLAQKITETKAKISAIRELLEGLLEQVLASKIVVHTPWKEDTSVVFEIAYPKQTLYYTPEEGNRAKELRLRLVEESGELEIEPVF